MKNHAFTVTEKQNGLRLDAFLFEAFKVHSKSQVRKWIIAGCVYLNGKRVRIASKAVLTNAKVEVWLRADVNSDPHSAQTARPPAELTKKDILFEDEYLIIVNKPAGLPTQATLDNARDHLTAALKRYLEKRGDPSHSIYLALHHRLDRDTSGVLMLSKSRDHNREIGELFSKHQIEKTYLALTERNFKFHKKPGDTWQIKNHLGVIGKGLKSKQKKFGAVRSGGDVAITEFEFLQEYPTFFYLQAKPKTGRTHQIRVHLSEIDLPILGDLLYGGKLRKDFRGMGLHAYRLKFIHPVTQKEMLIEADIPSNFQRLLKSH